MRIQISPHRICRAFCSRSSTVHRLKQRTVCTFACIVRLNLSAHIRCRNRRDLLIGIRISIRQGLCGRTFCVRSHLSRRYAMRIALVCNMRIQTGLCSIRSALCRTRFCVRILEHILCLALWVINACQHIARTLAVLALFGDQQPVRGIGRRMSGRCSRAYIRRAVKADLVSGYIRLACAVLLPHVACFLGGLTGGFRSGAALFRAHAGGLVRLTGAFRSGSCGFGTHALCLGCCSRGLRIRSLALCRGSRAFGAHSLCLRVGSVGLCVLTSSFRSSSLAFCRGSCLFCRYSCGLRVRACLFGICSCRLCTRAALFCGLTGAFRAFSLLFRTRACLLRRFSCILTAFAHSLRRSAVCLSRFPCVLVCNAGILGRNAVCLGIRSAGFGRNTRRFILCTDALCVRPLAFCRHAGRFGVHSAGLSRSTAFLRCVALVLCISAGGLCLRTKILCQYACRLCRRSCGLCVRTVILRLHSQVFRCYSCSFCLNAQRFRARPVLRFILYENHVINHCVYCIRYAFPHKAVKLRLVLLCVAGQRVRQTDAAVFCNILCCDLVIGNSQCITSHLFRWCNA